MADKKMPPKTEAGVATTIAACATSTKTSMSTDPADMGPRAAAVAYRVNSGGTAAEIAGAGRMSQNMGQCVADAYDEKKIAEANKPSMWRDFTAVMGQKWDSMAGSVAGIKDDVKLVAGQAVMSGVSAVTNDTPQVIQEHQARTQQAAAMTR